MRNLKEKEELLFVEKAAILIGPVTIKSAIRGLIQLGGARLLTWPIKIAA